MIDLDTLVTFEFRDENGLKLGGMRAPDYAYDAVYREAERLADKFKCVVEIVEVRDAAQPQKANG